MSGLRYGGECRRLWVLPDKAACYAEGEPVSQVPKSQDGDQSTTIEEKKWLGYVCSWKVLAKVGGRTVRVELQEFLARVGTDTKHKAAGIALVSLVERSPCAVLAQSRQSFR